MRPTNVPRPLWPRAVWGCRRGWGRGDCRPGTLPPWEGTRTGTSLRLSGDPSPYGTGSLKHCPAIHLPCFLFIRGLPFPSPIFPFLLLWNPFHLTFTQHPLPPAPPPPRPLHPFQEMPGSGSPWLKQPLRRALAGYLHAVYPVTVIGYRICAS